MFGLFAPKCPVDTYFKTWTERRMLWLAERFGLDRMTSATVVLPTPEFFPDPYTPDEAGFRHTVRRVCGHMRVEPQSVQFALEDDDQLKAAGLYVQRERSIIYIARGQLADPTRLIATLAHELAHELLLKGGHLTADTPDHELVTDLLPVFLGMGIFAANGTLRESSWSSGQWSGWSVSRQGYLSLLHLGYALGVFAYARGERSPKWVRHLRPDARETTKAALGYLRRTDDSLFHPAHARPAGAPSVERLREELTGSSPTVRLNALWDFETASPRAAELLPAVEKCISHPDGEVRRRAVTLVGEFGPLAARNVPALLDLLFDKDGGAQAAAATALGLIGADPDTVVPALGYVLKDPGVAAEAAGALVRFGPRAATTEPQLLAALDLAGNFSQDRAVENIIAALLAAVPDAAAKIKEKFATADAELRREVIGELLRQSR